MFTTQQKKEIAEKVQRAIRESLNEELPVGEVNFILHVDGGEDWSWANIRNSSVRDVPVPEILVQNLAHLIERAADNCLLGGKHEWRTISNGEYTKVICGKCGNRR